MTEPAPAAPCRVAHDGPGEPSTSPRYSWFRTHAGRRYGREIALIIVVKLALLLVLWFAFIKPWLRPAPAPASVIQQLYASPAAGSGHD